MLLSAQKRILVLVLSRGTELRQLTENQKEIKQKPMGILTSTKVASILSKPEDNAIT
jgi:hypothetical protein